MDPKHPPPQGAVDWGAAHGILVQEFPGDVRAAPPRVTVSALPSHLGVLVLSPAPRWCSRRGAPRAQQQVTMATEEQVVAEVKRAASGGGVSALR